VSPNDNRTAAGKLNGKVLELRLVARIALWRPEGRAGPEVPIFAFAEDVAGSRPQIPGPLIRVPVGTEVRVSIRNSLPAELRIFGLQDRPGDRVDSLELAPGERREARFRVGAPGTYLYWARTTTDTVAIGQLEDGQLSGAIVVDSLGAGRVPNERVFVMGLWKARETPPGTPVERREETLVFNGRAWPTTERLSYNVGDSVRWRVINATRRAHPMHLHGFYYRIDARGTPLRDTVYSREQQRLAVTERLAQGTSMSMTWAPHTPGNWLFHCHLVEHIAGRMDLAAHQQPASSHKNHALQGMSGLVLGITVRPRPGAPLVRRETVARRTLRLFATERPRMYGDASAYSFVLQEGASEPAPDSMRVPGTPIVLTRGEPVAITVLNRMRVPVTVHWHGIELESYFDGVGDWSGNSSRVAPSIASGDSFVVRLTPDRAGSFIYHTHQDETRQLGAGLFGPLLVLEPGQVRDTVTDRILLMGTAGPFSDSPASLNGLTTAPPMELRAGTSYRLRFINISANENKAVRLLADTAVLRWRALGKDGAALPAHQAVMRPARLLMGAGETWDVELSPP
ncbi:MAG: multicopper oxidase domain-containing protein, partial [Gemmatimonadaceae bacterium]